MEIDSCLLLRLDVQPQLDVREPTAVLAALLTLSFALSMTVVLGPHEPLNYSVFGFAFASLYLGLSQDVE